MSAVPESFFVSTGVKSGAGGYKSLLTISGLLFLLCVVALIYALATNPEELPWPYIVVNYTYFLGLTQFGVAFVAIMRICNARWARPFYRVAEALTLSFFPIAILGFLCIYFFGRDVLFDYWLNPKEGEHISGWLNSPFLLWRNVIALLLFYAVAVVYVLAGLIPDMTEENASEGPKWRQAIYKNLLSRKSKKSEEQMRWHKRNVYFYSSYVILACALALTFISWDLGMTLVSHYHSTVFPMYFMMGCMFAGSALIFLMFRLVVGFSEVDRFFDTHYQGKSVGILLTGFALLWLYFFWAQFFVSWYGNLPYEYGVISKQMYGHYAPMFWLQILCLIGIPIGSLIFAKVKRTIWPMILLSLFICAGVWLNRYLIVMPAYYDDHQLLGSIAEFVASIGFLSGFLFLFLWTVNAFPMASTWELEDASKGPDADSPRFGFD
ncbi:MAG: hypothetical protein AAF438_02145 [Pseudomonadota bacterium]